MESHYLLLAPAAVLSSSSSGYRGIARATMAQSLPAEGPARELWMSSVGTIGSDRLTDRAAAVMLRDRLHELGQWFECVEVTQCVSAEEGAELERRAGFLGYDVANGGEESVLAPRMMCGEDTMAGPGAESRETWELCRNFCTLAVNANGLLDRYQDGELVHQIVGHLVKADGDRRAWRDLRVYALHGV